MAQAVARTPKPYKVVMLVGAIVLVAGVIVCLLAAGDGQITGADTVGQWAVIAGVVVHMAARVAAWWTHG